MSNNNFQSIFGWLIENRILARCRFTKTWGLGVDYRKRRRKKDICIDFLFAICVYWEQVQAKACIWMIEQPHSLNIRLIMRQTQQKQEILPLNKCLKKSQYHTILLWFVLFTWLWVSYTHIFAAETWSVVFILAFIPSLRFQVLLIRTKLNSFFFPSVSLFSTGTFPIFAVMTVGCRCEQSRSQS